MIANPQDVLPSEEELQKLNRDIVVAYAARNSLRALVSFRMWGNHWDAIYGEALMRSVQAALVGCTSGNVEKRLAAGRAATVAAEAAEVVGSTVAAYAAARAAAATAARSAAAAADATAFADRAASAARAADAAFHAATTDANAISEATVAAREDYRLLADIWTELVPPQFFRHPLWPAGNPAWWERTKEEWHKSMKVVGLGELAAQYDQWVAGDFDSDQMLREVKEWNQRHKQLKATNPNYGRSPG